MARAWFRYGAVSPGQRILRACSRAGALLWRDMADPAPVSRMVSPMDRGRPDRLDVRHSIHCPPIEGRFRTDEPLLESFHDPVHCREQRRGPRPVQGADGREGDLAEESPRTARRVMLGGSLRLVHLCHRVHYQAPDGCLLCSAAGSGMPQPVPPSARHGAAGSAKHGAGWGLGREHVRQVHDGPGVPQVHVDPPEGGARGARVLV